MQVTNHENMRTIYFNGTKFTRHENAILAQWYHPLVLAVQGLPTIETVQYESRNHIAVSPMINHSHRTWTV